MYHGLTNRALYTAFKIVATYQNQIGDMKDCVGTAFFLGYKGNFHLISNRHIFDAPAYDRDYENYFHKATTITGRFSEDNLVTAKLAAMDNRVVYSEDPLNDIACICNPQMQIENHIGGSIQLSYYISESLIAKEEDFISNLSICDFVAFPGFPEWHDKIECRPILRSGTIASDPRFNYKIDKFKGDCLAYEAFSYGGSSGSPVFALEKGIKAGDGLEFAGHRPLLFIGINAGHMKSQSDGHSGISYLYKSPAIIKTIERGLSQ